MSIPPGSYGRNIDPPTEYLDLSAEVRQTLLRWISRTLRPTQQKIHRSNSYGLKHHFEEDTGIYVCNGAFKGAMRRAGYEPVDEKERNWRFRCSSIVKGRASRGRGA